MESQTLPQATLVDLLDRVLDRGLVINTDIIICLAGVPLIGINLRAALAGIDTMLQYGTMADWDQNIRSQALRSKETAVVTSPSSPLSVDGEGEGGEVVKVKNGQSYRN